MWRRKKLFIITGLVAVIAALSITSVVLAQSGDSSSSTDPHTTLMTKVAAILGIDQQTLENAFTQAQKEIQSEALDSRLADMVAQGKITQEEADQYKAWYEAKPNVSIPGFGFEGRGLRQWHREGTPPCAPANNQSTTNN